MNNVFNPKEDLEDQLDNREKISVDAPQELVHIRFQQRNLKGKKETRKGYTIVEHLATDLDLPKILKYLKKIFNTNGCVEKNKENGEEVIRIFGDKRKEVANFLTDYCVCKKEEIKIHGD